MMMISILFLSCILLWCYILASLIDASFTGLVRSLLLAIVLTDIFRLFYFQKFSINRLKLPQTLHYAYLFLIYVIIICLKRINEAKGWYIRASNGPNYIYLCVITQIYFSYILYCIYVYIYIYKQRK